MNRCCLVGRLGAKPELRYTPSGTAVCTFRIAIDRQKTKSQRESGERPTTDWIPIVVWGKQGESCAQYLDKGKMVSIEGRIQIRTWEKDGQKRTATDVVADAVQFLSPRDNYGGGGDSGGGNSFGDEIDFPDDDDNLPF